MRMVEQITLGQEPALWRAVGNTPLLPVELPSGRRLYLKAEWLNPGGSVKDRAARAILKDALCRGELPGRRLLDASSGNTGIAYAMLGAAAGVEVTICLPANASPERRALLEIYGAEVILTSRLDGTEGATARARELLAEQPDRYYFADQYSNPANTRAHRETTGPEIWAQTGGQVTHFVAALGTTGTMMGTGGFLREKNSSVRLIGVQPDSPYHGLEGLKHLATTSHLPALYDPRVPDSVAEVPTETADRTARWLARETGYLVGWSAGAAVSVAIDILEQEPDAHVVAIGCDSGARYLSEPHRWREP
jgi:S-sulfo-L-cysteine synthase (O-acetyl-L-serine-dependent)